MCDRSLLVADAHALQADNPTTYAKLAESGHVRAQYNLGWCYEFGLGESQDPIAAQEWYTKVRLAPS